MRAFTRAAIPGPLACLLLGAMAPAHAIDSIDMQAARISGEDWSVANLRLSLDLDGNKLAGEVRIGRLDLPAAELSLEDVIVTCGSIEISGAEFGCSSAAFTVGIPGAGRETFPGEASYNRRSGTTRFRLRNVPALRGMIEVRGVATEAAVELEYAARSLQLSELAAMANSYGAGGFPLAVSGAADASGHLHIADGSIKSLALQAEVREASISNEAGTVVTDSVRANVGLDASVEGDRWRFAARVSADAGEAYVEPVYTNLAANRLVMTGEGHASADFTDVEFASFTVAQASVLDAHGNLHLRSDDSAVWLGGTVEFADSSLGDIYTQFLQVFLTGTLAGDLDADGTVAGRITIDDNQVAALDLVLKDVSAEDRQGRFSIHALEGTIHWPGREAEARDAEPSRLRWRSASGYDIPFGESALVARLGGDDFHLVEPMRLPTMGGALLLKRLQVDDYGTEDPSGVLDAELEPIELGQLTGAFGWPSFSGSLAGNLPLLRYDGGVVTVGGSLTARAFDGDIELANLRLEEPFGLAPQLYGDLRLRQLDLEQLTDTFSFGLIQGRLSGDVAGLHMSSWQPVAMDLYLYTPPGDRSERRISQRAVENLASVGGGGAAAALSSGFMKFFEEFSYDRIGIRCILRDGTCAMSGAGPAGEGEFGRGYYIVKGSGLPRIDVVGYRHQVSWNALVRQLINITESGAPVVN